MEKGVLRFFFDYGAGGCLWAGDAATLYRLGVGPVDATLFDLKGRISKPPCLALSQMVRSLRDQLDSEHSCYLNPLYQPDPSLWSQSLCDRFNTDVERLLLLLRQEIGDNFHIVDEQTRYVEDADLNEYLAKNPSLSKMNEVVIPTVL
ncbi:MULTISPECIES: hypothetical protein [Agrobacterium]|uniref:Uncharacterized protein n=1 Tax=Agrobacterium tumefaciens TaxID=358 RepID=A0AAE6EDW7_AGRTU|nr:MULTISPECIES: hypothetical protein [Agrobacterium]QCL72431.1 hypothetical protein CFBP5499_02580 [Agrobacterium tumefaciens]QCL78002.1 hypothetical protein CFBP5877_02130 [Agrobacterium tumefaciens]